MSQRLRPRMQSLDQRWKWTRLMTAPSDRSTNKERMEVPDGMLPEDVSEKPTTSVFLVEQVASFSGASCVG